MLSTYNRGINFSARQSQTVFRCFQHSKKYTYVYPQVENDSVHKMLESLPAYKNHILPSPKSCRELVRYQSFPSSRESCNCQIKCIFSRMPRSRFVESKPRSAINVTELLSKQDINSSGGEYMLQPTEPELTKYIEDFKSEFFENFLLAQELNNSRLLKALSVKLQIATDLELTQIMLHMSLSPFKLESKFADLMNMLDKECCKRYLRWSVEQQFYVADIWYHLNLSTPYSYNSKIIKKMSEILNDLTNFQLIHLLFLINLRRKASFELMHKIEKILESKIDSFSAKELTVIAMAYFKTETKLSSSIIILTMIKELTKSFANMSSFEVVCIVKALRYSYSLVNRCLIEDFLKKAASKQIWRNCFQMAGHLCLLAYYHNLYVPELLDQVTKDLIEFDNVRLKEIANVLMAVSRFNLSHPPILNSLSEYCQKQFDRHDRQQEINDYYQHYISCLLSLSYLGIFIHKELHKAFSKQWTKLDKDYSRNLGVLDCITEIDEPLYTGNRLSTEVRFGILKKTHIYYSTSNATKTTRGKITMDLTIVLQKLFNKKMPLVHILPYMTEPVILLIFDGEGQLCEPTDNFMNLVSKGLVAKPTNKHSWVVIWPLTMKERFSKTDLVGLSIAKERHFIKLGFKIIKVPVDISSDYEKSKGFLKENLKCFLPKSPDVTLPLNYFNT